MEELKKQIWTCEFNLFNSMLLRKLAGPTVWGQLRIKSDLSKLILLGPTGRVLLPTII